VAADVRHSQRCRRVDGGLGRGPSAPFHGLLPTAPETTSGPEHGSLTARRPGKLRLLTTPNWVPVTAALPLRPVGKGKSPGIPVKTGFSGLFVMAVPVGFKPSLPHSTPQQRAANVLH